MLETTNRKAQMLSWVILSSLVLKVGALVHLIKHPPLMTKEPPPNQELLFRLASEQAEKDHPFVIECEALGNPAPKYTWMKNGELFDWKMYDWRMSLRPGGGTLVITSPREEDIGQYQCFARNELGVAASNSVFVRKSHLNSFKREDPKTKVVKQGEPTSLPCQPPDGYPRPIVYWMTQDDSGVLRRINSTRMTVGPEGALWFSSVTREDQLKNFTYVCLAKLPFSFVSKLGTKVIFKVQEGRATVVEVKKEPKAQYISPKNTTILKGNRLQLWCIYSGTPLPQIQWKRVDGRLPIDRVHYENYGKTLVIKSVDFEDEGVYECVATNGVGRAQSYTMNVRVEALPYFTVEPERLNRAEGETAEFKCEASGKPEPKIYWTYNGKLIENAQQNPNREVTKNSIRIFHLTKADTGNYGCNATNDHGYTYKDVFVNVVALPPVITEGPSDVRTVAGSTVTMICRVIGAPKPRIYWVRYGQELTRGRYHITEDGDLIIQAVSLIDRGDYTCRAVNRFGSQVRKGSLEVKKATVIMDAPQDHVVAAGSTATFRCNAVSDESLELNIDWLIDEKKIDFEQEPRFVKQSDHSLSITRTTQLDSGAYTCLASTELDETRKSATLIVQDVPNAPKLLSVECHDRHATITWEPRSDNRAPILGYIIQHKTSFTPNTWEDSVSDYPAQSTRANVTISPGANYTFRVIARNKIGRSLPSLHSIPCTTPEDVPYKNPDGVQGKGSSPQNLVIKVSVSYTGYQDRPVVERRQRFENGIRVGQTTIYRSHLHPLIRESEKETSK